MSSIGKEDTKRHEFDSFWASQVSLVVKNPPANAGDIRDAGSIPGQKDPLEEGMATHFSILAWRVPRTEEPAWWATVHRVAKSQT